MKHGKWVLAAAAAALVATAAPLSAASTSPPHYSMTFDGAITTLSPTFVRPETGGTDSGRVVAFDDQGFYIGADSDCYVVSAQDYDGFIIIYSDPFDSSSPLSNFVAASDDLHDPSGFGFSEGFSRIPNDTTGLYQHLTAGSYHLVTTSFASGVLGQFQNSIHCSDAQPTQGIASVFFGSVTFEQQVYLGNLFPVYINWETSHSSGIATPVRSGSIDTAKFWFFANTNWEVMIKILNGCALNNHYWIFFAALTNQGFTLHVKNPFPPFSPSEFDYSNALGHQAETILDTSAIPCPPVI